MADAIGSANRVDLNTASEDELEKVGGLGRERARRIIGARPLAGWEDVERIEGFGGKLTQDLKQAGARIGGQGGNKGRGGGEHAE